MADVSVFGVVVTAFSLIPILGGLFAANMGRRMKRRGTTIAETETSRVRDIVPGAVEVKGVTRATSGRTVGRAPISRGEALAYTVVVERYDSGGGESGGGGWTRIYSREESAPFVVDDGTGKVGVDPPSDATHLLEMNQLVVSPSEDPPPRIQQFIEREGDVDGTGDRSLGPVDFGSRRRYSEGVLEPGEDVYVLGRARAQQGWDEQRYVIDEPHPDGEFLLSDKPEEQLVTEQNWQGILLMVVGAIAVVGGVVFLLAGVVFFL